MSSLMSLRKSFISRPLIASVLLMLLSVPTLFAEEQHSQAKALFLFNFANFVRWPKQAFTQNHDKLKMCIFGDANLGSFLDQVDGTRIRDKRLLVIKTNVLDDIKKGCHILFVSQNKQDLLPTLFNSVQHIYVLSVSDVEGFARNGGVISIVRTFDKLTFEINLDVALKNGLLINSDLLSLARIIGRDGKPVKKENLGPEDTLLRPQMAK